MDRHRLPRLKQEKYWAMKVSAPKADINTDTASFLGDPLLQCSSQWTLTAQCHLIHTDVVKVVDGINRLNKPALRRVHTHGQQWLQRQSIKLCKWSGHCVGVFSEFWLRFQHKPIIAAHTDTHTWRWASMIHYNCVTSTYHCQQCRGWHRTRPVCASPSQPKNFWMCFTSRAITLSYIL